MGIGGRRMVIKTQLFFDQFLDEKTLLKFTSHYRLHSLESINKSIYYASWCVMLSINGYSVKN